MFLLRWMRAALQWFNLLDKSGKLIILGLDNAGKTTLLGELQNNQLLLTVPTERPQQGSIKIGNVMFKTYDLGGHLAARKLWKDYLVGISGVLYMVDAADLSRLAEAKEELWRLLQTMHELNVPVSVPVAVVGNKTDKPRALTQEELSRAMDLDLYSIETAPNGTRQIKVFTCSVVKRRGHVEPIRWLANAVV